MAASHIILASKLRAICSTLLLLVVVTTDFALYLGRGSKGLHLWELQGNKLVPRDSLRYIIYVIQAKNMFFVGFKQRLSRLQSNAVY